jgi:hypothetical protein
VQEHLSSREMFLTERWHIKLVFGLVGIRRHLILAFVPQPFIRMVDKGQENFSNISSWVDVFCIRRWQPVLLPSVAFACFTESRLCIGQTSQTFEIQRDVTVFNFPCVSLEVKLVKVEFKLHTFFCPRSLSPLSVVYLGFSLCSLG